MSETDKLAFFFAASIANLLALQWLISIGVLRRTVRAGRESMWPSLSWAIALFGASDVLFACRSRKRNWRAVKPATLSTRCHVELKPLADMRFARRF